MGEQRIFEIIRAANWLTTTNIKHDDSVVLLTTTTVDQAVVEGFQTAATAVGADVTKIVIPPRTDARAPFSPVVSAAVLASDVVLNCTLTSDQAVTYGFSETIVEFVRSGGRHLKIYTDIDGFTGPLTSVYQDPAEFESMRETVRKYTTALTDAASIRFITDAGTDIEGSIDGRVGRPSYGIAAEQYNHTAFPTGEVDIDPVTGSTNGTAVINASMGKVGQIVEPIELTVTDGQLTAIDGGREARKLETVLGDTDSSRRNFAEFGLGMNPFARIVGRKNVDKKVLGSGHIALGDSHAFKMLTGSYDRSGGVSASTHVDGIMREVTAELDGKVVIEHGELQP